MNEFRGNPIKSVDGEWFFVDDNKPVKENWQTKKCGFCNLDFTKEGHDGCLGTLPGVMNACCGHGTPKDAYVQFNNGEIISGLPAVEKLNELKV